MSDKTFTVAASANVDITLNDGTSYRLKSGLNHDVPDAVANHWYAKASGCVVIDEKAQREAQAKAQADAEAAEQAAARKEAEDLGIKVDGRWSHERLLEEIAEAKVKAGK